LASSQIEPEEQSQHKQYNHTVATPSIPPNLECSASDTSCGDIVEPLQPKRRPAGSSHYSNTGLGVTPVCDLMMGCALVMYLWVCGPCLPGWRGDPVKVTQYRPNPGRLEGEKMVHTLLRRPRLGTLRDHLLLERPDEETFGLSF